MSPTLFDLVSGRWEQKQIASVTIYQAGMGAGARDPRDAISINMASVPSVPVGSRHLGRAGWRRPVTLLELSRHIERTASR